MRGFRIALLVGSSLANLTAASAQNVLDGPLSAPGGSAALKATPSSGASKHPKKMPRAAKKPHSDPALAGEGPARDLPSATHASASKGDDPLSFDMKWNGSNDNGSQTRVQNYNGNAAGTGAEVGLKLHF